MAFHFNRNGIRTLGNQGVTVTAFDGAYIPAINFGLKINIPNQQSLQSVRIDFILHEIIRGVIQPQIVDSHKLLAPLRIDNQYSPRAEFINTPNFYIHQVNVTPEVNIGGSVDLITTCYHL